MQPVPGCLILMSSVQSLKYDVNGSIVGKACPRAAVHLRMLWHFIFMSYYKIKAMDEGNGELRLYDS